MIRYKLVTQEFKTRAGERNETVWTEGVVNTATGHGGLCTNGVIHSYETPALAVLLNPIHANIENPRLIEIECSEMIASDDLKGGNKSATMIREIPVPEVSHIQRIIFAILCVRAIPGRELIPAWELWADNFPHNITADYTINAAVAAETVDNAATTISNRFAARAARAAAYSIHPAYAAEYAAIADRGEPCGLLEYNPADYTVPRIKYAALADEALRS